MTDLEVCNWALAKLGEVALESLDDPNHSHALRCKALLHPLHQSLLRQYEWSFATVTEYLSPLSQEEAGQWIYPLPRLCLRVVKPQNLNRRGMTVYSSIKEALSITYIKEVKISDCDPLYCEVLACKLAFELCVRIREAEGLKSSLSRDFENALDKAVLASSKEYPGEQEYYD